MENANELTSCQRNLKAQFSIFVKCRRNVQNLACYSQFRAEEQKRKRRSVGLSRSQNAAQSAE